MILRSLQITNFRSFRGHQTIEFPHRAGLYFLWGRNDAEPRLQANGSGKSSIWKALTWLFYGKDDDGLAAGDISNWEVGKKTSVKLGYLTPGDGEPVFVERTWNPNSWTYRDRFGNVHDLTKDASNQLKSDLLLEYSAFLSCAVMAQNRPMFLDMKASAKAQLFAEVMQLDKWLEYSETASKQARDLDSALRGAESREAMLAGRLEQTRREDVVSQRDEWESSHKKRLDSLAHEYAIVVRRLEQLKEKRTDCLREADRARAAVELAAKERAAAKEVQERLRRESLGDVPDAGSTCPTCGQGIRGHFAYAIREAAQADTNLINLQRAEADANAALRGVGRDIDAANVALDSMEAREDEIAAEKNPYDKLRDERADTIKRLENEIATVRARAGELSEAMSIRTHLARWFKEIRLGLIGDALDQLEIEVNSCVNALGLDGWELRFDVDRETASGTVQRGFNVLVRSPHNSKAVPWEAWSGGEAQRLRLAGNMGLANLIRARTGCTINVEVWDEPTNGLSAQGTQDLLEGLAERAEAEQRQIWVVDHHTLGFAGFAGMYGVIKDRAGSAFVAGGPNDHERKSAGPDAARGSVPALPGPRTRTGRSP